MTKNYSDRINQHVDYQTFEVLMCKHKYAATWRDKSQLTWVHGLLEEVCELMLSLIGLHDGPVDHELMQIAAICMNWREYRAEQPR